MAAEYSVRLKGMTIENFKSVEYGRLDFDNDDRVGADIIGIYGQNGSGKTACIEALAVTKHLLVGAAVPDLYSDCVSHATESSTITLDYELFEDEGEPFSVTYSFRLRRAEGAGVDLMNYSGLLQGGNLGAIGDNFRRETYTERLTVTGEDGSVRTILDTDAEGVPFRTDEDTGFLKSGRGEDILLEMEVAKRLLRDKSASFIFSSAVSERLSDGSFAAAVIGSMKRYARESFFVVDTKSSGYVQLNYALPIYTRKGVFFFMAFEPTFVADDIFDFITSQVEGISQVLSQMVPGLSLGINVTATTTDAGGAPGRKVELISRRGDVRLPLRYESDGVRKIISQLAYIIAVYNDESVTVAMDEMDSGVFEFLLGEILMTLAESGRGQLIFTSHNLRPLEVVDSRYLYFTTTDPKNRYVRMEGEKGGNLRSKYYRRIMLDDSEQHMYSRTKKYKMMEAMRRAGGLVDEEQEE